MLGSAEALKWAHREISHLETVLSLFHGRTACVQAGGNLGVFPRFLSEKFTTCYVFEPAPDLFDKMLRNAPAENIVRFQAALGCTRGLVGTSRVRRDGKPNAHEGITHVVPSGTIPTLLIDDLALPVCDLIQLDVEGYELAALYGAVDTLARCRPVVMCEVNKNLKYVDVTEADIEAFFTEHGYTFLMSVGSDRVYLPESACP